MDVKALHKQLASWNRWKQQLDERLLRFERWGEEAGVLGAEARRTLRQARQLLHRESFTVAFVGEFSRGKTELINALLYTEGGRRLLPSQPGRTTMCPAEIYRDAANPHCVRLLPIETRRTTTSLESFKRIPRNWITIPFNPDNPDEVRAALHQVSCSKWVSQAEAEQLGFSAGDTGGTNAEGLVSIPCWRHAMISLDHPLLRQGLRIVDTPGLNALGNEPELTLKTLPEARAVLFLLAADAGVTASDMAIWREHIQPLREDNCTAVVALLNKIDSLWDDLIPAAETEAHIQTMREETARQLGMSADQVVALSARQGLLARAGGNRSLLLKSNFLQLERLLGECVVHNRQQVLGHRLIGDSFSLLINARNHLKERIGSAQQELVTLGRTGSSGAVTAKISQLRSGIRKTHHQYHKQSLSLRTSQRLLEHQRSALQAPVSLDLLERYIGNARENLTGSWTTLGLSRAIGTFFDDVDNSMRHLEREIERANKVLTSIYERPENGSTHPDTLNQHLLRIHEPQKRLRLLHNRADQFRRSINSVLASKTLFISRFINTLVEEVRVVWKEINRVIERWLQEALAPLFHNNHYQKQLLEHHMMQLTRAQGEHQQRAGRLKALQSGLHQWQRALKALEPLYQETLHSVTPDKGGETPHSAQVVPLARARVAQG